MVVLDFFGRMIGTDAFGVLAADMLKLNRSVANAKVFLKDAVDLLQNLFAGRRRQIIDQSVTA